MREPFLKPEDYLEPMCPFCDPTSGEPRRIPVGRVLEKLDEHLARRDAAGALRHLDYWLEEARRGRDEGGELTLLNEKMGLLRKEERHEEAIKTARAALALLEKADFGDCTLSGTTFLNAGTVMSAAGQPAEALRLYERAEHILTSSDGCEPGRLAGLFNNKAVVLFALGRVKEAEEGYFAALARLDAADGTQPDRAVTWTNLADLYAASLGFEEGEEKIAGALDRAAALLDDPACPQNAYTAFIYAKCAPTFVYYGRFVYAEELRKRSEKLYERA